MTIKPAAIAPLMTEAEIACLTRHLAKASSVLEYGVGGSTLLAAAIGVPRLYGVDSDAAWIDEVSHHSSVSAMIKAGRARLVHVDLGPVKKFGKPKLTRHLWRWPNYAKRPWQDGFRPDFILIDGRFRISCIMEALRHSDENMVIAVHDFWTRLRKQFNPVLRYVAVVDTADSLVVLKCNGKAHSLRGALSTWWHRYDPH